jgi:type IV pilus assembly protein PilZ
VLDENDDIDIITPDLGPDSKPEPNASATAMAVTGVSIASADLKPIVKHKTLSIIIRDRAVLFAAYMPFLKSGGLFIPTKKMFSMGESCTLIITLLGEEDKFTVNGKVVWITPPGSPSNKAGGIGVEFAEDLEGERLKRRIEEILGPLLRSTNATHTM